MFPEYIERQSRGPFGQALRLASGHGQRSMEDYEQEGRTYYGLAAGHRDAHVAHLSAALTTLADNFTLAEKPLSFLAGHYLQMRKHTLFEL